MSDAWPWILGAGLAVALGVAALAGRGRLRAARREAARILDDARRRARQELARGREALEDERVEAAALAAEADEAHERRRRELGDRLERRAGSLDEREAALASREARHEETARTLEERSEEVDRRSRRLDEGEGELRGRLEAASGVGRDEARRQLLAALRSEVRFEAASELKAIKDEARDRAETEARKIVALAIERLAPDFSAERSVSTVALPDPSLKGRVIGAEGKNIRALESETGMQILLDETPGQIVISGFHPVNREVTRLALGRLLEDGRIYPKRIASVVASSRRQVDAVMRKAGEEAVAEFGIDDAHPEMVELLGRLHFRTSYSQNVLQHVRECAYLCGIMAAELGLDQKLAQRAGLFHDIGKAIDYEREGTHPEIGEKIARRLGEPPEVVNAIASHHEDCEVISPISVLVAAADSLSGARPGARRRTTVDYVRRIQKLEEIAGSYEGVGSCYALQAGREIRVICSDGSVDEARASMLASDLAKRIESEMDYPGRIKVTVIRETRAVDYAR